ncbi:MAG: hypothetical protein P1R58_08605 [bacterium]|nr:hypothetical protein [bacterium]
MFKKALLIVGILGLSSSALAAYFESHNISLYLDVPANLATISDSGTIVTTKGDNYMLIAASAREINLTINGKTKEILTVFTDSALSEAHKLFLDETEPTDKGRVISFSSPDEDSQWFTLSYQAEYLEDTENIRFSNENVGREVTGTIFEKGAYLSPGSYFYPQGLEETAEFSVMANIPAEWESVADGNRISSTVDGNRKIQEWQNPYKSDGLMFFAAPFVTKSAMVNEIEVACYFFEEDTFLIDGYLEATVDYINMYSELIGPYPYERFTVAENFFPTGYGMPAWTLLGQQVIRLPFIKATSLGHEVLHNWWGNSVYVDYERGNWCESATVYGADYRYKLMQSEDAAKDYRKNILKQYHSYVTEGNDFPINEFTSRTSPNTRTIGYNKAMMVWHLIQQEIGEDAFFGAWKDIYRDYIGKKISWQEWIDTFEKRCNCDLSYILREWINRAGAPLVGLELVQSEPSDDNRKITFRLTQSPDEPYNLSLPLRLEGPESNYDTTIALSVAEREISMNVSNVYTSLAVDPDYHIFRKLYDSEIEPIVSGVTGKEKNLFASGELTEELTAAFLQFGENMTGSPIETTDLSGLEAPSDTTAPIILNPDSYPDYLTDLLVDIGDTIFVDGTPYPREGHTFVMTAQNWLGHEKCMVVVSDEAESLPRVGQLLPHYGKYSYLVFQGGRNIAKGQWPVFDSPLRVEL